MDGVDRDIIRGDTSHVFEDRLQKTIVLHVRGAAMGEGPRKGHVGAWRGGSDDVCMYCEVCWWMSADVGGLRLYCIVSIGASRWASRSRHRYEP